VIILYADVSIHLMKVKLRDKVMGARVASGIPFSDLLTMEKLPFKIPVWNVEFVKLYPHDFENGNAEYGCYVDAWLEHMLVSMTSEQAVVGLDTLWQVVLRKVAKVAVLLNEHDASSMKNLRPDFTALFNNVLVMKGEAKASHADMMASSDALVTKFHKHAYKLFPKGCNSIPAVMTCNEIIYLYSISYFNDKFTKNLIKSYRVSSTDGCAEFIVDLFKILIWIVSQAEPVEIFHLVPGVRKKTRNGHHITLLQTGLFKEFDSHKISRIKLNIIKKIYSLNLANVEWGSVNGTTLTITRVGSRLRDAYRARNLNLQDVHRQVCLGIAQLHAYRIACCDICVDNIFVDSVEDGGAVFIGDLEYCCRMTDKAPTDLMRSDRRAKTAMDLDGIQLEKLKDEMAQI